MSITYLPGKEPHPRETRRILKNVNREGWNTSIDCYLADGGYEELKKALGMEPRAVIDEVKKSGLRGRGGAGFPTGVKWTFIPPNNTKPVYLVCNCDESEPGTFKDRYILHYDPHQLIEGLAISAFATNTHLCYIYIRCEFPEAARIVWKAIQEARARGFSAVYLAVDPNNERAVPLYISLEYYPTGEHLFVDEPEVPQVEGDAEPSQHYAIYKKSLTVR